MCRAGLFLLIIGFGFAVVPIILMTLSERLSAYYKGETFFRGRLLVLESFCGTKIAYK
jgi:hypothetical protein